MPHKGQIEKAAGVAKRKRRKMRAGRERIRTTWPFVREIGTATINRVMNLWAHQAIMNDRVRHYQIRHGAVSLSGLVHRDRWMMSALLICLRTTTSPKAKCFVVYISKGGRQIRSEKDAELTAVIQKV